MPPLKLPKGAIKPRPAVLAMAPYSPPTGGRADKLRLDFNENTVGCSPKVIEALKANLSAADLAVYPEYTAAKEAIARYFRVSPDQFVFTNGTDEAIQVFINTYIDDGQEVLVLKPAYAMYRFYAEVAGAKVIEVAYPQPSMEFPLQEVLDAITPQTRAVILSNPNNPTGTGLGLLAIERILARAKKAVVMVDEAYYEFSGVTALTEIERVPQPLRLPHVLQSVRHGGHAPGLPLLPPGEYPVPAQSAIALQREFAGRDGRAGRGGRHRLHRKLRRRSAGRARTALRRAWRNSASPTCPVRRISSSAISASAPSKSATACADRPSWCATAATKRPAASASPWARATKPAACWPRWKRSGTNELNR